MGRRSYYFSTARYLDALDWYANAFTTDHLGVAVMNRKDISSEGHVASCSLGHARRLLPLAAATVRCPCTRMGTCLSVYLPGYTCAHARVCARVYARQCAH